MPTGTVDNLGASIALVYRHFLGREPEEAAIAHWSAKLQAGLSFPEFLMSVDSSEEAHQRRRAAIDNLEPAIALVYRHILGREPEQAAVEYWSVKLQAGLSLSEFLLSVESSEEAHQRRRAAIDNLELSIALVYRHILGREPEEAAIPHWSAKLQAGLSFPEFLMSVDSSEEAHQRQRAAIDNLEPAIALVYRHFLGREVDQAGIALWLANLKAGLSFPEFLMSVDSSEEAKDRRGQLSLAEDLSDGQFLVSVAPFLFGRGIVPKELEGWTRYLAGGPDRRRELVLSCITALIRQPLTKDVTGQKNDPDKTLIMGTDRVLTREMWNERAAALSDNYKVARPAPPTANLAAPTFIHSGEYVVSAICSLYKGGAHIERFLDNITSQTLFHRSELIIIDADSPDGEANIIRRYRSIYPNIVYRRINHRISVYEAWNIASKMARGRYVTNVNVDDLRRQDSFEIQSSVIDRYSFIDAVYQDFFYSFDPSLSFDAVQSFGFKSELPIVTPHNLLVYNSLHNAPMWRRRLHDELGYFNTSYKSAGDVEFWMRSLSNRKVFFKINEPHVAYYCNPEGISTKPDTEGINESNRILAQYSQALISDELRLSLDVFADLLGVDSLPNLQHTDTRYYDIVQEELRNLGARHKALSTT